MLAVLLIALVALWAVAALLAVGLCRAAGHADRTAPDAFPRLRLVPDR